jgi:predicted alpha/beta superfamily hydrolase
MNQSNFSRRDFLRLSGLVAGASLVSACTPATVEVVKTVEVIKECTPETVKVLETVEVEKECNPVVKTVKTFPFSPLFQADSFELLADNGWTYEIFVAFPGSYPAPDTQYPVLYVLDADYYQGIVTSLVIGLSMIARIPEMIITGIGYHSDSPDGFWALRDANMGSISTEDDTDSAKFLSFIEKTLIPAMESKYPVTQERLIFGHSLGGNFGLYAMLKKPGLFQYIHSSSPNLTEDSPLLPVEAQTAEVKPTIPASILFTMGSGEDPGYMAACKDFSKMLQERGYEGLQVQYMETECGNEGHASASIPALWYGFPKLIPLQAE